MKILILKILFSFLACDRFSQENGTAQKDLQEFTSFV